MADDVSIRHPVAIGQVMVNFAARYGVDAATCLLGTGIEPSQLRDADALIERDQEMRLVENLILALPHVQAPGFQLGLQYNVATFGTWGFVLRISRNVIEAMRAALRYLPLSTAYCQFTTVLDEHEFSVVAHPQSIPPHLRQFLLERDTATALNLCHELGLSAFRVKRIEYQGPAPLHAAQIEALCGIAPVYRSSRNALVLDRRDAELPLPMYDPHLVRLLEDECRAQLEKRQVSGLSGQIRQLILGPLGLVASIDDVAQHLAMSPRSLRRRLDEEQTRFRQIVDTERRQMATRLLETTEMKLDEMAVLLGYSDTASFTRAFRRWFNRSPGDYRKTPQA